MKKILLLFILLFASFFSNAQGSFVSTPDGITTKPNGTPFQVNFNVVNANGGCASQSLIINIGKLEYKGSIALMNQLYGATAAANTDVNGNTTVTVSNIQNSSGGVSQVISIGVQFKENTCNGVSQIITARTELCNQQTNQQGNLTVTAGGTVNKAGVVFYQTSTQTNTNGFCLNEYIKYALYLTNTDINPYGYKSGFDIENVKTKIIVPKCAQILVYRAGTFDSTGLLYSEVTAEATSTTKTYAIQNTSNNSLDLSTNSGGNNIQGDYYFDVFVNFPCNSNCVDGLNLIKAELVGDYCNSTFTKPGSSIQTDLDISCNLNSCNTSGNGGYHISYNDYNIKCVGSCTPSQLSINISTPPNSTPLSNKSFTVSIPTGITLTSVSTIAVLCSGVYQYLTPTYYSDVNGTQITTIDQARLIKWTWPTTCTDVMPSIGVSLSFNFNENTQPTNHFLFTSTFKSGASIIVSNTKDLTPRANCDPKFILTKEVKSDNDESEVFSNFSSGFPDDVFTYKLNIYNYSDKSLENIILEDALDSRLEYIGNLRYTIGYLNTTDTPIDLTNAIPEYGNTISVQPPSTLNSNTLRISGLDFSCENSANGNYLMFYFDVKMKSNVQAGTSIPNSFKLGSTTSGGASILVGSKTKVTSALYGKCPTSTEWIDSAIRVKNGETVDFKMKFTNEGTVPVQLESLINQKPQIGDKLEYGLTARNSAFKINYNCSAPPTVSGPISIPTIQYNYSQNTTSDSGGAFLCATQTGWNATCSVNSNWFQTKFLSGGVTINPAESIEVIYKGVVSGGMGDAYNSFSFKLANCTLIPSDSNVLRIINDDLGCELPQPCSDLVWSTDGTFTSSASAASSSFGGLLASGGWSNVSHTPDVRKLPMTHEPAHSINTNIGGVTASNEIFVGAAGRIFKRPDIKESFKTTIPNLVPGTSYRVEFQQINLTDTSFGGNTVNWKVRFGNQIQYSPALITSSSNVAWTTVTLDFVAASTTQDLVFEGNAPTVKKPWWFLLFLRPELFSYVGIDNIKVTSNNPCPVPVPCFDCTSFDLLKNNKYLVSAWVKEEDVTKPMQQYKKFDKGYVSVSFTDVMAITIGQEHKFYATGEIIDGWQRIVGEFVVPENVDDMKLELVNEHTDANHVVYFDDVRVLPSKGNMKSFVYDQKTQRLMAELDENNYSTFYEYDLEGGLIRIKKETEKGVFTIQETRSGNTKKE